MRALIEVMKIQLTKRQSGIQCTRHSDTTSFDRFPCDNYIEVDEMVIKELKNK